MKSIYVSEERSNTLFSSLFISSISKNVAKNVVNSIQVEDSIAKNRKRPDDNDVVA